METYTEIGQHSQDVSSSVVSDHGSISFGRFAVESLAWEKWSVFRHDRCQEELEMYKSNGLVAQKKAYFEEYYKRVRALKGLESKKRADSCADVRINSVELKNDNLSYDMSGEGKSDSDAVTNLDCSAGSTVDEAGQAKKESLNDYNSCNDNLTVTDEANAALVNVDQERFSQQACISAISPVSEGSSIAKHDSLASDPLKLTANEQKKSARVLKAKGNAASAQNKSKLECTSSKDAVKASTKSKTLPLNQITRKRDNILLPSKINSRLASSGKKSSEVSSRHKVTEVRSSAAVLHPSSTRMRVVPSSPIGRSDRRNTNTNGKDLPHSLRTSQPVHARAVQNPPREKSITNGLKDNALEKQTCHGVARKPSELSSQQMRPKVRQSENQRPNTMSTSIDQYRLIRDTKADCGRKNYGKERKEKEGEERMNSICRRDTSSSCNLASSILKNLKLVHKEKEEISTISRRNSKCVSTLATIVEKKSKPLYKKAGPRFGGLEHTLKGTKV